jgi:murein DD-endopeptidase MepM/ murein hydrolase activator NlpD
LHLVPEAHITYSGGVIRSSLHQTAQAKGLDQKILSQLTRIFRDKINFSHDVQAGDTFNILYDEEYLQNKKIGTGEIEAAEIMTHGNQYKAVRYIDSSGHTDYYTPEGLSLHKGFIRFPVHYSHISSRYSVHRLNPVTHLVRPHMAIDFAAPPGTPIKAAADGRITFIGRRQGYGKAIIIRHFENSTTLYAHMRNFAAHLHAGSHVKEGDIIGYVGDTGRSTGPHLHYELRRNGVKQNPLTVALPSAAPLNKAARAQFIPSAKRLIAQLEFDAGIVVPKPKAVNIKLVRNGKP